MKNDLNKIKKLSNNQELTNRVGVAMFMYARNLDLENASDGDKALVKWLLSNPMAADQTMVALVATETDVITNTTITEETVTPNIPANNPNIPNIPNSVVNLDEVSDEIIEQAVSNNWKLVANKYGGYTLPLEPERLPSPVSESVKVVHGEPTNVFLENEKPVNSVKPSTRSDGAVL